MVVVLPSSLSSLALFREAPSRPPAGVLWNGRMDARMEGVCERNWYVRRLRGVL